MVSVLALKSIPEIMHGITLESKRERDCHGPGDSKANEHVVDDVKSADCENSPVEKEDREFDHTETNRPEHMERVFRLFVDQELMCMSELAVDELLMCSQASECGCYSPRKKSASHYYCVHQLRSNGPPMS